MNTEIEKLQKRLSDQGEVKKVLTRIAELTPKVKWGEVKEMKGDKAIGYRMEGMLEERFALEVVAAMEVMLMGEEWVGIYRTSVQVTGMGGYVNVDEKGVYSRIARVNKTLILSYSTVETDQKMVDGPKAVKVKEEGERKLPGEDVAEITETYFFSPGFQAEVLGFLTRMTLYSVPRELNDEVVKEIASTPSGSELLHYHVKKEEKR